MSMDGDDPHVPTDLATDPEWTETAFDREGYGPDEYDGLAATFERDSMTVSVVPVRYECSGGRERLRALDGDLERTRRERTAYLVDVPQRRAFATHVECRPYSSTESAVPFVAADAGDALAVAVWLTRDADTVYLSEAFRSGMNVGREILSTMINTLLFAYLGVLLPFLLVVEVFDVTLLQLVNYSFVGVEILRVIAGLIGLSLIIPTTAFISAWWSR